MTFEIQQAERRFPAFYVGPNSEVSAWFDLALCCRQEWSANRSALKCTLTTSMTFRSVWFDGQG